MADVVSAERRLRLQAEDVVARCHRPQYEVFELLEELGAAALAVAAVGLVEPAIAERVLVDTADALVVRGADWLHTSPPDLPDVGALYDAATAETALPEARAVAARAGEPVSPERYLERLAWQQLVRVRRDHSGAEVWSARRQLTGAAAVLGDRSVVAAFDAVVVEAGLVASEAPVGHPPPAWVPLVAPPDPEPALVRTVSAAPAWTVEEWSDHWRVALAMEVPAPPRSLWSATDDAGNVYGGSMPDATSPVRFDPALRPTWNAVTVSMIAEGGITDWVLRP